MPVGRFQRRGRFLRRFRQATRAALTMGNRVQFFSHGAELFADLFRAIDQSREFICLEFYIVRADRLGQALSQRLTAAAARGVRVCLIYDYIGSFDTPALFFRNLELGGVVCCPFNPPSFKRGFSWLDKRDHRKIAIIDGSIAFTGGINIGNEYAGHGENHGHWRDLGISLEGPAVSVLLGLFGQVWATETGTRLPWETAQHVHPYAVGDDEVYIVSGGPHHNRSFIRSAFRMAIAGASERIVIVNPYFIPGPRIIRSLIRAVRRGVDVQLILPARSDVPLIRLLSRGSYGALLKAGISIYERQKTVLHTKLMLVDGSWSVVGSANFDQRSFHRNYEVNCIVTSQSFGQQVEDMLAEELAESRPVILSDHERRGLFVRLLERGLGALSWFL